MENNLIKQGYKVLTPNGEIVDCVESGYLSFYHFCDEIFVTVYDNKGVFVGISLDRNINDSNRAVAENLLETESFEDVEMANIILEFKTKCDIVIVRDVTDTYEGKTFYKDGWRIIKLPVFEEAWVVESPCGSIKESFKSEKECEEFISDKMKDVSMEVRDLIDGFACKLAHAHLSEFGEYYEELFNIHMLKNKSIYDFSEEAMYVTGLINRRLTDDEYTYMSCVLRELVKGYIEHICTR